MLIIIIIWNHSIVSLTFCSNFNLKETRWQNSDMDRMKLIEHIGKDYNLDNDGDNGNQQQ